VRLPEGLPRNPQLRNECVISAEIELKRFRLTVTSLPSAAISRIIAMNRHDFFLGRRLSRQS
jgi:hypothetical protein